MKALVTQLRPDKKREKGLVTDWPDPGKPQGNQVRTQTIYSGITNGTERNDLTAGNYATPDERLPSTWGYQNVGRVIECGPDCQILKVGDVIYSSADHVEFTVVPEDWLLIKVPEEVDPTHAAIFGMTSVAMRTCRHADIRMGERVLVVGAGIIGQVAAQIATAMGGVVHICDVNAERLELSRQIGAVEKAIDVSGDGWQANIADAGYEVIIDVAGVPGMEDKLILAAAWRGRIMFIAGRQEVKYTFNVGQGREITIKQNSHFDVTDLGNLCRLVATGKVQLKPLITQVVPVEQAKEIYDQLRDTPEKLLGTVFKW